MVKIGKIELSEKEADDLYFSGRKYIVAYRRIYALEWCSNYVDEHGHYGGIYAREMYYHRGEIPLTKRGRFFAKTAEEINKLIGKDLLICG